MINLNSLQAGGMQPEADNYKQLAIDLQNKVQNQMYDVEEAVMEMLQTGEDPNSVGMALMTLGYKQEDVIKLFQSLQQQQQPSQEEVAQDEETSEVEQMVEDTAPMQQPMAKKGGSFKDWYKQLGGGTHNTYYGKLPKAQIGFPGTIDQTQFPGFTFGETTDYKPGPEDEYSANEVKGYLDFAKDLSGSNLVNKGSMGIQPSTGYEGPAPQKVKQNITETPFTDAVNAISFVNRMFFPQFDPNRVYEQTMADNAFAAKNYQPALGHKDVHRGIQQSGLRVPFINFGQNGKEMNKFEDYYMMRMGGMNPMYDYFMENNLPLYQVGGSGGIDLSPYPMDENGLYILNAIPDLETMRAAARFNQNVMGIVPSRFGPRVDTIRTQYQQTPPALQTTNVPLTPEEQRAREQYIIKLKEQHKRVKDKRDQGPAYQQRYGGDPFMSKRKLRKKKGGQIADIPTEILKKLMAKGGKFDIL